MMLKTHRSSVPAAALAACLAVAAAGSLVQHRAIASTALPPGTIQWPAGTGVWAKGPPTLPPGTEIMVLEGNPSQEALFTIRLKLPAGTRLAPHWHPRDERVTVLSGEVRIGFGDTVDEASMTSFPAGSYYVNPAKSYHFVAVTQAAILQVTGHGPWEVHFLAAN